MKKGTDTNIKKNKCEAMQKKKTKNVIKSAEKIWQESMRGKRKLLGISILTQEMIVVEVNMYNREGYLA